MCEARKVLFEERVEPDPAKLAEVRSLETEFRTPYPKLRARFEEGNACQHPDDCMALISEVVDCLLQPLRPHRHSKAIILVGSTGAGKSTTSNWLLGKSITKEEVENSAGDTVTKLRVEAEAFRVGCDDRASQTFIPRVECLAEDLVLVDFPGFMDTSGPMLRIGIDIAFRLACSLFRSVHVLALIAIDALKDEKGSGVTRQLSRLTRFLPTTEALICASERASPLESCKWFLGITKCHKSFMQGPKLAFQQVVQLLRAANYAGKILNMNDEFEKNEPAKMVRALQDETQLPLARANSGGNFIDIFNNAFGAPPSQPKALATDCLSANDCEKFKHFLMTSTWTDKFLQGQDFDVDNVDVPHDATFSDVKQLIQKRVDIMRKIATELKEDAEALRERKMLRMERRSDKVWKMCRFQQCRLKAAFVAAEKRVTNELQLQIEEALKEYVGVVETVHDKKCITDTQKEEVQREVEKLREHMNAEWKKRGFNGTHDVELYVRTTSTVIIATGSVVTLASAESTAVATGAATLANGAATAGAAVFGGFAVVLGIVALTGCLAFKLWTHSQSREVAQLLMGAIPALQEAFDAIGAYLASLEALEGNLNGLSIETKD